MLPPTFWINIDPSQCCGKMKTFAIWNICFLDLNDQKKRINQLFWAIFQLIFSQFLKERYRVLVWVLGDHPLHLWPQSTQKQPQSEPRYPQISHVFLCPHSLSTRRAQICSPTQIFALEIYSAFTHLVLVFGGHLLHPWTHSTQKQPQNEPRYPQTTMFSCIRIMSHPGGYESRAPAKYSPLEFFFMSTHLLWVLGDIRYTHDPRAPKNSPKTSPDTPQTKHVFLTWKWLIVRASVPRTTSVQ